MVFLPLCLATYMALSLAVVNASILNTCCGQEIPIEHENLIEYAPMFLISRILFRIRVALDSESSFE